MHNTSELLELIKKDLYTPVVGDILDQMGLYHQFLPQAVRPLKSNMKLAGFAMPVLMIDVYGAQKKPFGLLTEALDDLHEHEIYIAGVLVIPKQHVDEVIGRAINKVQGEKNVRQAIENGMSATEAFATFGIL